MDLSYIATKPKGVQRPRTLVCYICGKEYGTKRIEKHLVLCKQNWDDDQILKAIEIVLNQRFSGEDIGQVFEVTFNVFNGSSTQETFGVELIEGLTYIVVEN